MLTFPSCETRLELENRSVGRERQCFETRLFLGEGLVDDALRGGMDPGIGHRVQPVLKLSVGIVEVAERTSEEEVLAKIAERPLDLALRFCPIRPAGTRLEAVMSGKVEETAV
jgi:hypothetical protein